MNKLKNANASIPEEEEKSNVSGHEEINTFFSDKVLAQTGHSMADFSTANAVGSKNLGPDGAEIRNQLAAGPNCKRVPKPKSAIGRAGANLNRTQLYAS